MIEVLLFICVTLCVIIAYLLRQKNNERELTDLASQLYGTDVDARLMKLCEEYFEVRKSWKVYQQERTIDNYEAFKEELCDLSGVLTHLLAITQQTQDNAIERVLDKIKGRITDPDYLRKHKHELMCCGNCARANVCKQYKDINDSCTEWEDIV